MTRALWLAALVGLVACGDNGPTDCACTVSIGEQSLVLGCGEQGCLGGSSFGCEEDDVIPLGSCVVPDGGGAADGGPCQALQSSCDPAGASCCPGDADGAAIAPACDAVARRCCVPVGERCSSSADCCPGHPCVIQQGLLVCGSS